MPADTPSALPILEINDQSFRINQENFLGVLRQVADRPFVLYSINGSTRTGKSYALNYFVQHLEARERNPRSWSNWLQETGHQAGGGQGQQQPAAFSWRSGPERETTGINLWSKPYFVKDSEGREIAILLMDCQGLFDQKTTNRQNAVIFSLSTLCSSVSIFNVLHNVNEKILEEIRFFSGYAHLVTITERPEGTEEEVGNSDAETATQTPEAFQKLIFLVRDFGFPDYTYGFHHKNGSDPESPKNFFHHIFIDPLTDPEVPPENKIVRRDIMKTYKDLEVSLVPGPGNKFLRDGATTSDDFVEFRDCLKNLVEQVTSTSSLVTKKVAGCEVTGTEFQRHIEAWARLCTNADLHFPAVQTLADATAQIKLDLTCATALDVYEKGMEETRVEDEEGLQAASEKFEKIAYKMFDGTPRVGSQEIFDKYRNQLKSSMVRALKANRRIMQMRMEQKKFEAEMRRREEKKEALARKREDMLARKLQNLEFENVQNEIKHDNLADQLNRLKVENETLLEERRKDTENFERQMKQEEKSRFFENLRTTFEYLAPIAAAGYQFYQNLPPSTPRHDFPQHQQQQQQQSPTTPAPQPEQEINVPKLQDKQENVPKPQDKQENGPKVQDKQEKPSQGAFSAPAPSVWDGVATVAGPAVTGMSMSLGRGIHIGIGPGISQNPENSGCRPFIKSRNLDL